MSNRIGNRGGISKVMWEIENQISKTKDELKLEIKIREEELEERAGELERVRYKNMVILARLEELWELDELIRIEVVKEKF